MDRTDAAVRKLENVVQNMKGVDEYFAIGGMDIATGTSNSNVATIIVALDPWDERKSKDLQLSAILANAQRGFAQVPEAFTFAFGLPPILGLSPAGRIPVYARRPRRRRHPATESGGGLHRGCDAKTAGDRRT